MDMPNRQALVSPLKDRNRSKGIVFAVIGLLVLAAFGALVHAQNEETPVLLLASEFRTVSPRQDQVFFSTVAEAPVIDGQFHDQPWLNRSFSPLDADMIGGAVSRTGGVRVYNDDKTLFIGFECHAPAIDSFPIIQNTGHDQWSSEDFRVYLAPDDASNQIYIFAVDPNGGRCDWNSQEGLAWNPEWQAKTLRSKDAWQGEIAIPFKSLGVETVTRGTIWNFNLSRHVSATNEQCSWRPTDGNLRNRFMWGHLFFGEALAWKGFQKSPTIAIAPDHWKLSALDYGLRLALRIQMLSSFPETASLHIEVLQAATDSGDSEEGEAAAGPHVFAEKIIPAGGNRANLVINVKALPVGDFVLKASLANGEDKILATGQVALSKAAPLLDSPKPPAEDEPLPPPERIELHVPQYDVKTPLALKWPISTAVALPRGALFNEDHVRLLGPDAKEVPCQQTIRARWPSDGSIRWLGIDFQADIRRPGGTRYTLEYGPNVTPAPFTGFVRDQKWRHLPFEPVEKEWLINTGPLLFTVHSQQFAGIHEAWVDVDGNGFYDWNEQIVNATRAKPGLIASGGPYMVDNSGWTYRFMNDRDVRLDLEEWNELRLVLRGEARLILDRGIRSDAGEQKPPAGIDVGRCVMRIIAYAGMPFVRMQVRFYLDPTAANNLISDIGIIDKLDFRGDYDAVMGLPGGFRKSTHDMGTMSLMKLQPNSYYVFQPSAEDPIMAQGTEGAENWVCAAGKDRGVAVCIRDMDKLFPKEIELRPEGAILAHLWPTHGSDALREWQQPIDRQTLGQLGFAHGGRRLDLHVPSAYSQAFKDGEGLPEIDVVRDLSYADPTGLAVSGDLLYVFYSGALDEHDVSGISRAYQMAPHAVQDHASLVEACVFPEILPKDRADRAAALADKLLKVEQAHEQAGMFNYMDLHGGWLGDENRWNLRNHWVGARGDVPGMLWSLYLQTGLPELYLAADRNIEHVTSVDICHYSTEAQSTVADPRLRNIAGGFGDARTPVHWQSTYHLNDRFVRLQGPQLSYYLAANPWAEETIWQWGDAVKTRGVVSSGLDGAIFLDNLRQFLRSEYNGILHEKSAECASYLFSTPVTLAEEPVWCTNLRYYAEQTGDKRAMEFLKNLKLSSEMRESFGMLCLLRDLYAATDDASYKDDADKLITEFERKADDVLAGKMSPDEAGISWEMLAVYVFGAAEAVTPD